MNFDNLVDILNETFEKRDEAGFFEIVEPYLPALKTYASKLPKLKGTDFQKVDFSIGKMESIALDFFNDLNPEFEDKILDVLEDVKGTIMSVHKPSEKASGVSGVFERYVDDRKKVMTIVSLNPKDSVAGMSSVVHEFGHLLSQGIQQKQKSKTDCLWEVGSVFFERAYADWLCENGLIDDVEKTKLLNWQDGCLKAYINILLNECEVYKKLSKPVTADSLESLTEEYDANNKIDQLGQTISRMTGNVFYGEMMLRYVVAGIVSQGLYEDLKKDKEQTVSRLSNFLEQSSEYKFGTAKKPDGTQRTLSDINRAEVERCFSDLLGENYQEKLSKIVNDKTNEK